MKKRILILLAIMCGFVLTAAPAPAATLTILHTNDTHAHLLPWGPKDAAGDPQWGGMSRLATLIGMNRMAGGDILLVDAGDFSVGDFMFQKYLSIPELSLMKALGYDAIALGNHEFDLYPSTLMYELDEAGFPDPDLPILCANLDLTGDPTLGYFVQPYTVKEYGALKVGLVALLTEATNDLSNPAPIVVRSPLAEAQDWVDTLANLGCDLILVVSHLGFDLDQLLASTVSGIDVIIGGHSHTELPTAFDIGGTLVLQSGEFGHYLGKLTLSLTDGGIDGWTYELQAAEPPVPEEPTTAAMLESLKLGVEADPRFGPVYTDNIATAGVDLVKDLGPGPLKDTPLGNMLADAFRAQTGTDIALQPQGFCAATIYHGPVRGAEIFQAVPYGFDETSGLGFKLVTFETDGFSLMTGLEFTVYNLPYAEDFVLQSANMTYAYNSAATPGSRIDYSSIQVGGMPLDPFATYSVTTSDAVLGFVSQIPGFVIDNLDFTDDFVYTVARDFMVAQSPVFYYTEGRVIDVAGLGDPLAGAAMLMDVVDQFLANGSIDNMGIADAFKSKLQTVMDALNDTDPQTAIGALRALINHLEAQSGKHITAEAAERLMYLAAGLTDSIDDTMLAKDAAPDADMRPTALSLQGNHPNPFNPATEIAFTLGAEATVTVEVFNTLGQRVRVLSGGLLAAGPHAVVWNGKDEHGHATGSGVYFYRVSAGDHIAMGKMLMLK